MAEPGTGALAQPTVFQLAAGNRVPDNAERFAPYTTPLHMSFLSPEHYSCFSAPCYQGAAFLPHPLAEPVPAPALSDPVSLEGATASWQTCPSAVLGDQDSARSVEAVSMLGALGGIQATRQSGLVWLGSQSASGPFLDTYDTTSYPDRVWRPYPPALDHPSGHTQLVYLPRSPKDR